VADQIPDSAKSIRDTMSFHEQMLDAQSQCVPCKLCGGKAVISDAGIGAGYYIRCENARSFRKSGGCMIKENRLGGWAYNVMDAWNRLHAVAAPPAMDREAVDDIIVRIRKQADCLENYAESHGFSGKAPASVFHWQATHFRDLAAEMDRALSTLSADAIRQGEGL
jgi:hypothetical protein